MTEILKKGIELKGQDSKDHWFVSYINQNKGDKRGYGKEVYLEVRPCVETVGFEIVREMKHGIHVELAALTWDEAKDLGEWLTLKYTENKATL